MAKESENLAGFDRDVISEHIHDAGRELNENMCHWLQLFLEGKCSKEKLAQLFKKAYVEEEFVFAPWES